MKGRLLAVASITAFAALPAPGACPARDQTLPKFTALPLIHKDAAWAAERLRTLLGDENDLIIVADKETGTVFIRTTPRKLREAREILRRLDVDVEEGLSLIRLKYVGAATAVKRLKRSLGDDIRVTRGRRNEVLILASEKKTRQSKEILRRLDVRERGRQAPVVD